MEASEPNGFDFERFSQDLYKEVVIYIFKKNKLVDNVAIQVLSVYEWAKHRNFDTVFDPRKYSQDCERAKEQLKKEYSGKTLQELINKMINLQAEVIWLRRLKEGKGQSPEDYENDRWEAKRYIAYLFLEDIRTSCFKDGICPDFKINLLSKDIVDLLKSLTIEEYCRINGYLRFLERNDKHNHVVHDYDQRDYLNAMGDLDKVFLNCSYKRMKQINEKYKAFYDKEEQIKKAKYNTCSRLGCITPYTIEKFVDDYYDFINKVLSHQGAKENAVNILKRLYDKCNSRIVNATEFLLKCMIASYVDKDEHNKIRIEAGKRELERIEKKLFRNGQLEPFFK
jgi:hypothetical protein